MSSRDKYFWSNQWCPANDFVLVKDKTGMRPFAFLRRDSWNFHGNPISGYSIFVMSSTCHWSRFKQRFHEVKSTWFNGLFKVNMEFRISGVTWKMKYQFLLETGNWKPDSWLLSKKAIINWETNFKTWVWLLSLVEN